MSVPVEPTGRQAKPKSEAKSIYLSMKFLAVICTSAIALTAVFFASAGDVNDDSGGIQGSWQAVAGEIGGKPLPAESVKSTILKLADGKYEVSAVDGRPDTGTYRLMSNAKPKRIDVILGLGPNAGKTIPAIYELSGDSLKICYALRGSNAPTEFKTAAGTGGYLLD